MESMQDIIKKTTEDKATVTTHQKINLEPTSSYVVAFPHTAESLSVYSLQNASMSAPLTLQRKDAPYR